MGLHSKSKSHPSACAPATPFTSCKIAAARRREAPPSLPVLFPAVSGSCHAASASVAEIQLTHLESIYSGGSRRALFRAVKRSFHIVVLLLVASGLLQASTLEHLSMNEMANQSHAIVRAQVDS